MPRLRSRSLLSLLMLWQLLASPLAHPLEMRPVSLPKPALVVAAQQSDEDCAHAMMHMHHEMQDEMATSVQPAPLFSGIEHPCHSACKCPCAGTPALAFVLPVISPAMPDHPVSVLSSQELLPPLLANLLRPPIPTSAPA